MSAFPNLLARRFNCRQEQRATAISFFHISTSYLEELFLQANVSNGNSAFSLVNMISTLISLLFCPRRCASE